MRVEGQGAIQLKCQGKRTSEEFYGEHKGKPFFPNLQNFIVSDMVVGMELVADSAVDKWR